MIEFTGEICGDLKAASCREWLETNGTGGFASSTITELNTRRYHGLLVAQAWSVAELLCASVEDIYRVKPERGRAASA